MELYELNFGNFMQINSLDTFPGVMVANGKKLPAFKQKTLRHKVDGFGRLCPGTMKRLLEHNALMRTNSLAHHHMGAPDSLRDQDFFALYAALPTPETWFFRKNLTSKKFCGILKPHNKKGSQYMKKIFLVIFLLVIVAATFVSCAGDAMADLPEGNKLSDASSTDGSYRMDFYLCAKDGVMYIRGALTTVASGECKNIYWAPYEDTLNVEWKDDATISINDKTLDVTKDIYDCRENG